MYYFEKERIYIKSIIHISLFFDEIKVCILFPSKGFVQWNSISLAYLHSVRVLCLSANVKFACNISRIFNSERDFLEYSLRFFVIRMRGNSVSSVLSAFDCEEALYIVTSWILFTIMITRQNHAHFLRIRADTHTLHCYHAYSIVTSVGFQKSCCYDLK